MTESLSFWGTRKTRVAGFFCCIFLLSISVIPIPSVSYLGLQNAQADWWDWVEEEVESFDDWAEDELDSIAYELTGHKTTLGSMHDLIKGFFDVMKVLYPTAGLQADYDFVKKFMHGEIELPPQLRCVEEEWSSTDNTDPDDTDTDDEPHAKAKAHAQQAMQSWSAFATDFDNKNHIVSNLKAAYQTAKRHIEKAETLSATAWDKFEHGHFESAYHHAKEAGHELGLAAAAFAPVVDDMDLDVDDLLEEANELLTAVTDSLQLFDDYWMCMVNYTFTQVEASVSEATGNFTDYISNTLSHLTGQSNETIEQLTAGFDNYVEECAECLDIDKINLALGIDLDLDIHFDWPKLEIPDLLSALGFDSLQDVEDEIIGIVTDTYNSFKQACVHLDDYDDSFDIEKSFNNAYDCINYFVDLDFFYDVFNAISNMESITDFHPLLDIIDMTDEAWDEITSFIAHMSFAFDIQGIWDEILSFDIMEEMDQHAIQVSQAYTQKVIDQEINIRDLYAYNTAPFQCVAHKINNLIHGTPNANLDGITEDSSIALISLEEIEAIARRPYATAWQDSCEQRPLDLICLPMGEKLEQVALAERGRFSSYMLTRSKNLNHLVIDAWYTAPREEYTAEINDALNQTQAAAQAKLALLIQFALGEELYNTIVAALAADNKTFAETIVDGIEHEFKTHFASSEPLVVGDDILNGRRGAFLIADEEDSAGKLRSLILLHEDLFSPAAVGDNDTLLVEQEGNLTIDAAMTAIERVYYEELGHYWVALACQLAGLSRSDCNEFGDAGARFESALSAFHKSDELVVMRSALDILPDYEQWGGYTRVSFNGGTETGQLYGNNVSYLDRLDAAAPVGNGVTGFAAFPAFAFRTTVSLGTASDRDAAFINKSFEQTPLFDPALSAVYVKKNILDYAQKIAEITNHNDIADLMQFQNVVAATNREFNSTKMNLLTLSNLQDPDFHEYQSLYQNSSQLVKEYEYSLAEIEHGDSAALNTSFHVSDEFLEIRRQRIQQDGLLSQVKNANSSLAQRLEPQLDTQLLEKLEKTQGAAAGHVRRPYAGQELMFDLVYHLHRQMSCENFLYKFEDRLRQSDIDKLNDSKCKHVEFFDYDLMLGWESKYRKDLLPQAYNLALNKARVDNFQARDNSKTYFFEPILPFPRTEYKKRTTQFKIVEEDHTPAELDYSKLRDPSWSVSTLFMGGIYTGRTISKEKSANKVWSLTTLMDKVFMVPLLLGGVTQEMNSRGAHENQTVDHRFANTVVANNLEWMGIGLLGAAAAVLFKNMLEEWPRSTTWSKLIFNTLKKTFATHDGRSELMGVSSWFMHGSGLISTVFDPFKQIPKDVSKTWVMADLIIAVPKFSGFTFAGDTQRRLTTAAQNAIWDVRLDRYYTFRRLHAWLNPEVFTQWREKINQWLKTDYGDINIITNPALVPVQGFTGAIP